MKRSKVKDRIGALPDCLLVEIISRLPTIRSAIRTATLSRRWKSLWTSVHTLIFNDSDINLPPSEFVSFVDKTLTQSCRSKLIKLAIRTRYGIHFESQVNKWIRHSTSCNVEKLHLNFYDFPLLSDVDVLDEGFFINSYFTDLRLSCGLFNPKGAISWKRLRNLYISRGKVDVDVIQNILSGCPLLETLVLEKGYGEWQLVISSNEIKKLVFINHDKYGEFDSQINDVFLYAINSNVEVLDLEFDGYFTAQYPLNEYFFSNSCFTDLRLGSCIFDTKVTISWKMLRRLCISNGDLDEDMIENILRGSPLLETLELEDCYGYKQLDITSQSVKNLVINQDYYRDDEFVIANVINAPDILSLTIRGKYYLWKFMLFPSTMPSLVEVNIDLDDMAELPDGMHTLEELELAEEEILKGFIRRFCHVNELNFEGCYRIGKGTPEQALLEKYRQDMLTKYQNAMIASISEEVQQLKEKNQKMEHEQAEREVEQEQLKEKIQKLEHEQAEQEANRVMQQAEQEQSKEKIQKLEHEQAETGAKMKEMVV